MRNALMLLPLALALAATPAFAQDRVSIDTVNGSIHAEAGRTYGSLETVNGSIRVDADVRVGSAETVNGSIRIGDGAQVGDLETVNGSIHAGQRVRVDGDIETVNGGIFVDRGGAVSGGVETVNGAIGLVDTDVGRGIETVNGDVTVGVGSHVRGGILVEKPNVQFLNMRKRDPRIVIGPNAQVDGPLVFKRPVVLYVHDTAKVGSITGATAQRFSTPTPPAAP